MTTMRADHYHQLEGMIEEYGIMPLIKHLATKSRASNIVPGEAREAVLHSADMWEPSDGIPVEDKGNDYTKLMYDLPPIQSDQAARIFMQGGALEWALGVFLNRNAEYGDGAHNLGMRGQYADINRKVIKLKRYLWDGEPVRPGAEDVETIAAELIGHLLLLLDEQTNFRAVKRDQDCGPNYERDSNDG